MQWNQHTFREMPWRGETDAYKIWLSEVILQQTRVEQGWHYYERFVKKFPTIKHLAKADINEVLRLWEGLGYYSRARNLHTTAMQIVEKYNAQFPADFNAVLQCKGIGKYTASAICSFAFQQDYAVVDGNVLRILSRFFAIDKPIDLASTKNEIETLASACLPSGYSAIYNQAMLDFGAMVCKPQNPLCHTCCVRSKCESHKLGLTEILPIKSKKTVKKNRSFIYFVHIKNGNTFIQQRNDNDIWKGLYEFPNVETPMQITEEDILLFIEKYENKISPKLVSKEYKQVLSHQNISAYFVVLASECKAKHTIKISLHEIQNFAKPKIINDFLENNKKTLF